ncbi:MAG TPA: hypothetical protein VFS36_15600 [Chitinophagaceae bacterium]|nr:hypothetical protein [Chitinophagaceae bacterium]
MSNKDTITAIAEQRQPPASLLKGSYAYSYISYWRAVPPYKKVTPQLGCFYESPTSPGIFTQVPGYALVSYAAYIHFNGDGTFYEKGMLHSAEGNIVPVDNKGTYTLQADSTAGVITGTFTVSNNPGEFINHYFIMANDWKELHFMMLDTYLRQPITAGILKRIKN